MKVQNIQTALNHKSTNGFTKAPYSPNFTILFMPFQLNVSKTQFSRVCGNITDAGLYCTLRTT